MADAGTDASDLMAGLLRIESKLDALLEALADDESDVEAVSITTMDGQRIDLPAAPEGDLGLL